MLGRIDKSNLPVTKIALPGGVCWPHGPGGGGSVDDCRKAPKCSPAYVNHGIWNLGKK